MNWIKLKARAAWLKIKAWWRSTLIALALAAGIPFVSFGASSNLSWTLPTTYTDNSALDPADISEVVVAVQVFPLETDVSTQGRAYGELVRLPGTATAYEHDVTESGIYCYVAYVVAGGVESANSNESCKTHDLRVPNAPVLGVS